MDTTRTETDEIELATSIVMSREELPELAALTKLHRAATAAAVPPDYIARLIIRSDEAPGS